MTKLTLSSVDKTATTYRFYGRGWALCTVNDATGELLITSDWGKWSHRWNINHLGVPTLTAFIGDRDSVHYLADKLNGHRGQELSASKTIKEFRRMLCERRLEDGRDLADLASVGATSQRKLLAADAAREIWDALGDVDDGHTNSDAFLGEVATIEGFFCFVDDNPHESLVMQMTSGHRALVEIILPPLVEACRSTAAGDAVLRRRRHPEWLRWFR